MKIPEIKLPEGAGAKAVKIGGTIVGLYLLKTWLEKKAGEKAKELADGKLDSDPAAAQARGLDAALNPWGSSWGWVRSIDGSHPEAIYEIAEKISDYKKVQGYYKGLNENNRNLDDDLTFKLGDQGYQKFLALATKGKTGLKKYSKVRDDVPSNRWVITNTDANVRTKPVKTSKYWFDNNIVKLVPKGKIVGVSTGKFVYDEPNDVTYIEFYTLDTKKAGKTFLYVAKSQIEYLTNAEKLLREKSGKIPLEILAGLGDGEETPLTQAVSLRGCLVYDEQFKPILTAQKNIILGFPIMNMNTGTEDYVKIRTVQGKIRWVRAGDVRIQNRL